MNKHSYYIYNSTDQWKGNAKVRMISHSERKIVAQIKRDIRNDTIEYGNVEENTSQYRQYKKFTEDYENKGLEYVNNNLVYADVQLINDGELV